MTLKKNFVRELSTGTTIQDLFVVVEARSAQSRNGPYWSLTIQDASGRMEGKIWSPIAQRFSDLAPGMVVLVRGLVESYRDKPQLVVEAMEVLGDEVEPADLAALFPSSRVEPEILLRELEALLRSEVVHKPWKNFCARVLADEGIRRRLLVAPAAKSIHHAYAGGLLEHTLAVCRLCLDIARRYPGLDKEVLLLGAAFHDLGKAWELTTGVTQDYTDAGRLLGHIQLGIDALEPYLQRTKGLEPELAMHLKHLILSHHGEYEFGSPRRPKTAEALVLHFADMIDSKLNTVAGALPEECEAGSWSPFVRALDRFLYKAHPTPRELQPRKPAPSEPDQLCLLPLKG